MASKNIERMDHSQYGSQSRKRWRITSKEAKTRTTHGRTQVAKKREFLNG